MPLYNLRERKTAAPLFQVGRPRFGLTGYPVDLKHGDTWKGQFSFKHIGEAETITVSMGPFVEGNVQWRMLTMSVNRDAVETEYDTPEFSGPYDSRGLPHCRRIDCDIAIQDAASAMVLASDSSAERFHNVVDIARSFNITMDRYGSLAGWAPWTFT